jgi:arylsulfatase A-like enzyme
MMKLSRRKLIAMSAGLAVLPDGPAGARPASKRPNIVWIVCHDIHAPLIGCYGNELANTPAIDSLARDGVLFRNAFATTPVCAPSRFALVTGLYPQACAPAHQMRAEGVLPALLRPLPVHLRAAGYYCTNNVFTDYNMAGDQEALWDDCDIKAHWRNRPQGKPFFSVYNYLITHESRVFGNAPTETDPSKVNVPSFLPDTPEVRGVLARNIDIVNKQDLAVAHLLDELEADGLAEDTIVFFLADHGGNHPRSKRYCYDDGLHVPLIVRIPPGYQNLAPGPRGQPTDALVSLVDMAPTTLAIAGISAPPTMMGRPFLNSRRASKEDYVFSMRDRMDERYDLVYTARDHRFRYIRNYMPQRVLGQHGAFEWQSAAYQDWERMHLAGKLSEAQGKFWKTKDSEELYDISTDPHALVNLATDSKYHSQLQRMRQALDQHILATNDNGFIPEGDESEGYEASRASGAYPLQTILTIANVAIERDRNNIPQFLAGLEHPNAVVRFWNVYGIVLAGAPTPEATRALSNRLVVERVANVRCALAEGLIVAGDVDAGRSALLDIALRGEKLPYRVRALNVLSILSPDDLRPKRDLIEQLSDEQNELIHRLAKYLLLQIDGTYDPTTRIVKGPDARINQKKLIGDPQV